MLTPEAVDAFNTRLTANLNNIKTMTAGEQDRVKSHGSAAEALLKNKDLALFVHQWKFEILDQLTEVSGHTADENARRVALTNQLAGMESFVASLKRAVYLKNKVVTQQSKAAEPTYFNQQEINQ